MRAFDAIALTDIRRHAGLVDSAGSEPLASADAMSVATTTSQTTLVITDIGVPSTTPGTSVLAGDIVQKSGFTSGHTLGRVKATSFDSTGSVSAGDGCCGVQKWKYVDHIYVEKRSGNDSCPPGKTVNGVQDCSNQFPHCPWTVEGDSGAAVLTLGPVPQIIGIAVTAGAVSPVSVIMSRLGLGSALAVTDCGGGFSGCALATAAAAAGGSDEKAVPTLQDFRDSVMKKSSEGAYFVQLYEQYSPEAVKISLKHPSLLVKTHDELEWVWPWVQARLATGKASVSEEQVEKVDALLKAYAAFGPQPFQQAVSEVRANLRNKQLLATFGVAIQ